MRRPAAALFAAAVAVATPALAEVCDKVEPRWNPGDGPATVTQELIWSATSPLFLVLAAAAILAIWFGSRLAAMVVAISAMALGLLAVVFPDNEIMPLAIREGCITGYPTPIAAYMGLAIAICIAVLRIGRKRIET